MPELDLTDPLVRDMADSNHVPDETWTMSGQLAGISCSACGNRWPCPTRKALRALQHAEETAR